MFAAAACQRQQELSGPQPCDEESGRSGQKGEGSNPDPSREGEGSNFDPTKEREMVL
jgi:hypothetical protein